MKYTITYTIESTDSLDMGQLLDIAHEAGQDFSDTLESHGIDGEVLDMLTSVEDTD